MYVYADQQSGQWLIRAVDNHKLDSGARLKATDTRNLPKPVKVAVRTKDKAVKGNDELLKWIKYPLKTIKEFGNKIFTGFTEGKLRS
jgi:hypothetical protein